MTYPDLPTGVDVDYFKPEELQKLWNDIILELLDDEYKGRTHGNAKTYYAGCKGPYCLYATRVRQRRGKQVKPFGRSVQLDALVTGWIPVAKERIEAAKANMIVSLTA